MGHPIPVSFGDRGPSFPFEGKDPDQAAPIQLLAYHTAVQKSADVDQPRNLAKSVTVE